MAMFENARAPPHPCPVSASCVAEYRYVEGVADAPLTAPRLPDSSLAGPLDQHVEGDIYHGSGAVLTHCGARGAAAARRRRSSNEYGPDRDAAAPAPRIMIIGFI